MANPYQTPQQPDADPDAARVFDPTLTGDAPGWPKAIGIISIIWASMGMTCGSCGLISVSSMGFLKNMMPPDQQAKFVPPPFTTLSMVFLAMGVALAVFLFFPAIATLRRQAAGRSLHLVWAIAAVVVILAGTIESLVSLPHMVDWAKTQPKDNPFTQSFSNPTSVIAQTVGTGIFRLIWPGFCLIWFGVVKTRPEQMHGQSN